MSVERATKLRWFDLGAAAFERDFPGKLAEVLGEGYEPMYLCPICGEPFPRAAVEDGRLTAEHVPPDSLEGRELLLTCGPCNSTSGRILDAHARRKENIKSAMAGDVELARPLKVKATIHGHEFNARLKVSPGNWHLHIPSEINDPAVFAPFKDAAFPRGESIVVNFSHDSHADLGARISWFRSGFLAIVAKFGYKPCFARSYEIVRKQICEPDTRLIHSFMMEAPERRPLSERRLLWSPMMRTLGVQFGSTVMVYPAIEEDTQFYDRIRDRIALGPESVVTWRQEPFPTRPTFGGSTFGG